MINAAATHEKVRGKYGSVQAFCRELGIVPRLYYYTVNGRWPLKRKDSEARTLIELLRSEGLLVESETEAA